MPATQLFCTLLFNQRRDLILNAGLDVGLAPAIGIAQPLAVIGAGALPQRHTRKVAAGAVSIEILGAEEGGASIAAINTMKDTTHA